MLRWNRNFCLAQGVGRKAGGCHLGELCQDHVRETWSSDGPMGLETPGFVSWVLIHVLDDFVVSIPRYV